MLSTGVPLMFLNYCDNKLRSLLPARAYLEVPDPVRQLAYLRS